MSDQRHRIPLLLFYRLSRCGQTRRGSTPPKPPPGCFYFDELLSSLCGGCCPGGQVATQAFAHALEQLQVGPTATQTYQHPTTAHHHFGCHFEQQPTPSFRLTFPQYIP